MGPPTLPSYGHPATHPPPTHTRIHPTHTPATPLAPHAAPPPRRTPPSVQVRGSKFVRYQEAKVQESPDEVPQGSTPRSMVLHLRGGLTRRLKSGDSVTVHAVFLPEPAEGRNSRMRGTLLAATFALAQGLHQDKQSYQVRRGCFGLGCGRSWRQE